MLIMFSHALTAMTGSVLLLAAFPHSAEGAIATTTRYWDCSGGACGCAYLPPHLGGDNGQPAHCHSNAMFSAPDGNPYGATFYGTAAVSEALGGGWWLSEACGKCWKVTGMANIAGHDINTVTTLVLKGANFCPPDNPACCCGKAHFDIAAPGFDWAGASLANTCATREPTQLSGFQSCGNWMIASSNPNENCDCNDFTDSVLRDGCENFKSLYWDNPQVSYEEVECPVELAQLPCWEENGNGYPWPEAPDLCMDPLANAAPTPPVPNPTDAPIVPPTDAPVNPPTDAPIPNPTDPPVNAPTNPVPVPTNPPPTNPPPTNPAPTNGSGGDGGCCSQDYKTCGVSGWCNHPDRCETNCGSDFVWLEDGAQNNNCIARWTGGCTTNNDCCPGLYCDTSNPWWMSCQK